MDSFNLEHFHFLRPLWFFALLPLFILLYRISKRRLSEGDWASVVDPKKGEIFFNLGLTLHQMGKHLESAKHLQWALKLSPGNKMISESLLLKEHHCDNNTKIPCDLSKPEKHKVEGSNNISPQPHISQSFGGSGGGY